MLHHILYTTVTFRLQHPNYEEAFHAQTFCLIASVSKTLSERDFTVSLIVIVKFVDVFVLDHRPADADIYCRTRAAVTVTQLQMNCRGT